MSDRSGSGPSWDGIETGTVSSGKSRSPLFDPAVQQPAKAESGRRARKSSLDIPKITLFSLLGLESLGWGGVIGHLVKWAGNALYFLIWQVRYAVGYGPTTFTWWNAKDFWDRLPIHIQNSVAPLAAAGLALIVTLLIYMAFRLFGAKRPWAVLAGIAVGAVSGYFIGQDLAFWTVHWFSSTAAPQWWVTWRHDIRDVGISLFATIAVLFMFSKPAYPYDDEPGVRDYLTALPKGLAAALVPISAIGILAWQLPWLLRHGWQVPASYGALASEVNGFIEAGTWITVLMGILGGLVAKKFIKRIADDIQWYYAATSAAKIRAKREGRGGVLGGLDTVTSIVPGANKVRIIGTPAHRKRVQWVLDNKPVTPTRSPLLTWLMSVTGSLFLPVAGFGAWLTLAGPAAVH